MELGFNARCEDLRNELVEKINSSKLPITVVNYILQEIIFAVKEKQLDVINLERKAYESYQNKTQADLLEQEVDNGDTE